MWLAIGGVFAGSTAWAVYAELVTRVPWEKQQGAFYEMELQQSKQADDQAAIRWKKEVEPTLKAKLDRKAELEKSQESGAYAQAKARLDQLNKDFAAAEMNKTFGGSDLDEAYYHREEAEYDRDKVATEVRGLLREHFALKGNAAEGEKLGDQLYADPPQPQQGAQTTDKMFHLEVEIARNEAHAKHIDEVLPKFTADPKAPPDERDALTRIQKALRESKEAEEAVVACIKVEVTNQTRVDKALVDMARIDGPADPTISESDPKKRDEERKQAREKVCQGHEDTRTCTTWLKLEPVDLEIKSLDVDISKAKRFLVDADL